MNLRRLGSTKDTLNGLISETLAKENALHKDLVKQEQSTGYTYLSLGTPLSNLETDNSYKYNIGTSFSWCDNGGTFLTTSEDNSIRLYITPSTLMDEDETQLIPFLRCFETTPIICSAIHPQFSLYDGTCPVLVSRKDVPLKLRNLIPNDEGGSSTLHTYDIQHRQTDIFQKIHSLEFIGLRHFITGSNKSIMLFDVQRSYPTSAVPSNIGIISTLSSSSSVFSSNAGFYAGSYSNKITYYSQDLQKITTIDSQSGNGITQLIESNNGKYLYVIPRNSDTIDILDIRMGLQKVAELKWFSSANQRIKGDVLSNSQGLVIGSDDGSLLLYKDAELGIDSRPEVLNISESAVSSVSVHPNEHGILGVMIGDRSNANQSISLHELSI